MHEILAIDKTIRNMISSQSPIEDVYEYVAAGHKTTSLRQSLVELVEQGVTSMEELLKVTYYVE